MSGQEIDMGLIDLPDVWNRDSAGDLKGLTQSVKTIGQQIPVLVRPNPDKPGRFILVDGRRRYMAKMDLKDKTILAVVTNAVNAADANTVAMAVNLSRLGHNPVEIALSFQRDIDAGKKQKEIAASHGMSDAYVSQHLNLLSLPQDILKLARSGKLVFAHLRVFLRVFKEDHMKFFNKLTVDTIEKGWTPEEADTKVVAYLDAVKQREEASGKKSTGKKPGRPTTKKEKLTDYSKVALKPLTAAKGKDALTTVAEMYGSANTKQRMLYYKGMLEGVELAMGLRAFE
jgi:ParB/RepB/Spo0J family partition protein